MRYAACDMCDKKVVLFGGEEKTVIKSMELFSRVFRSRKYDLCADCAKKVTEYIDNGGEVVSE